MNKAVAKEASGPCLIGPEIGQFERVLTFLARRYLGHAGGVLVDDLIRALCDDRGLACWESGVDGHGKDVPVPAHLGEEVVDRTKNKYGPLTAEDAEDSGTLDILDGEFPFNVTRVHQALPPKVFAFTVVEDAWRVVESLYVDGGRADDPDAFVNACLLYTSPSPRDVEESRMPSSA